MSIINSEQYLYRIKLGIKLNSLWVYNISFLLPLNINNSWFSRLLVNDSTSIYYFHVIWSWFHVLWVALWVHNCVFWFEWGCPKGLRYLKAWSSVGSAVWGDLEGTVLLEEVSQWKTLTASIFYSFVCSSAQLCWVLKSLSFLLYPSVAVPLLIISKNKLFLPFVGLITVFYKILNKAER